MEGFNAPVEKVENGRKEKIEAAEKSVAEKFEAKLAEVLNRISENPYFTDLERNF